MHNLHCHAPCETKNNSCSFNIRKLVKISFSIWCNNVEHISLHAMSNDCILLSPCFDRLLSYCRQSGGKDVIALSLCSSVCLSVCCLKRVLLAAAGAYRVGLTVWWSDSLLIEVSALVCHNNTLFTGTHLHIQQSAKESHRLVACFATQVRSHLVTMYRTITFKTSHHCVQCRCFWAQSAKKRQLCIKLCINSHHMTWFTLHSNGAKARQQSDNTH